MREELIELTQKLIRIDSSNPPGKEEEIVSFIRKYLHKLRIPSRVYQFQKGRFNLVCKINSLKGKKKIILTPHIDTVPATGRWRFPPFSGEVYRGRIYGRGATDDKGNTAVALYLIKILKEEKIVFNNLDLIFAFTGDEETGSNLGIKPLLNHLKKIDYGIVLDGSEFEIIIAQKGLLHLRVEIFGKEAHGAYPHKGINAIEKSVYILRDILKEKFVSINHPLLNKTTVNIGRIGGGEKVNIVPGFNFFELDIRYVPGGSKERIMEKIKKIIEKYNVGYRIKVLAHQTPIEIEKNHFLIQTLKKVLLKHKIKPRYSPSFGATVINFLRAKGIESFASGFGCWGCAHIKDEYVKIDNLIKGVQVLKDYLLALDGYLERKNNLV